MIPDLKARKIVTAKTGPNGEPRDVALPFKWSDTRRKDYANFDLLSLDDKRHVILAITSFPYFHHRVFLPYYCDSENKKWPDKLWHHLEELCTDYQRAIHPNLLPFDVFPSEHDDIWRLCRVYPNRTLKTATTCYSLPLWLLGINNEARVLIATASETLGERHIAVVKDHIERNPYYVEVFGELKRDKGHVWAANKINVYGRKRSADASMEIRGWEGAVEGIGADLVIADDVQLFHNAGTNDRRARQWLWLTQPFEKRLDTTTRTMIVIQTRHADDDFAGRIIEEVKTGGGWSYKERAAIEDWPPDISEDFINDDIRDPDFWTVGNLKDPDYWRSKLMCEDILSLQTLLDEWRPESGRVAFYRTRLNKVRDESTTWFDMPLLESYARADGMPNTMGEIKPRLSAWDANVGIPQPGSRIYDEYARQGVNIDLRVVSIDTAATSPTPGKDPDYTVIQLWGMDHTSNARILLDMMRFRTGSPVVFKRRLKQFLDAYCPNFTIFEENGMARWIGRDLQQELGWPITPFFKKAEVDVEEFKTLIESGLMLYCWGDERSREKMRPFELELEAYPNGSHDDTLTAAVQAQMKLRPKGLKEVTILNSSHRPTVAQADNNKESISELVRQIGMIEQCLKSLT